MIFLQVGLLILAVFNFISAVKGRRVRWVKGKPALLPIWAGRLCFTMAGLICLVVGFMLIQATFRLDFTFKSFGHH